MPKFYLDVAGGGETAKDDMGLDAPDLDGARKAALSMLQNAARASAASQYPIEKVIIRDQGGRELMIIDAMEAGERHS